MLESLKRIANKPVDALPAGAINLHMIPPSTQSLFHLIRVSGKVLENYITIPFGDYYTRAKYIILEMRVLDIVWKNPHSFLMINPTLPEERIAELDPWIDVNHPGDMDQFLDRLKRMAIRYNFKPSWKLTQYAQLDLLKKVFLVNVDDCNDDLFNEFNGVFDDAMRLKPKARNKSKKVIDEIDGKIAVLRGIVRSMLDRDS